MNIHFEHVSNGVRIATDTMHEIETVSIGIQVETGAANETDDNNGLSHLLEHMAFKGTHTRNALQIAEAFDRIGGYFNAYTSREKTVYYAKVLKRDITIAADILADILQNSIFDEAELLREKDVILQEIAQTNDTPDDLIFDLFHETAYPHQAFGRSILGTKEIVQSISRTQILQYVQDNYYTGNINIVAAGKITHPELVDIAEHKFSHFPFQGQKYHEPVRYQGGEVRVERDLEQVHIVLGVEASNYTHPDYYGEQILALILGGGMSSRLFQEVREKRGLAYSVSAFCNNYKNSGMFTLYAATSPDKANECLDVMLHEIFQAIDTLTDDELNRAISQICASLLMSMENSVARADKLASNLIAYGRYLYNDEIIQRINAITKEDLRRIASKLFVKNSAPTLATIGKVSTLYNYDEIKSKFQ